MSLKENLRICDNDIEFKKWLLNIGDGYSHSNFEMENEAIKIPKELLSNNDIITEIFDDDLNCNDRCAYKKVILAPTNADVQILNDQILLQIKGDIKEYISIDSCTDDDQNNLETIFPMEFLNTLTLNGLPPHKLKLKEGAIVILIRNINLNDGLCNGTRLIVRKLMTYTISAEIISGCKIGNVVLIPRIDLISSKSEFPFEIKRRQFPIKLGYAMTINKSQGQTFEKVGVYLPNSVFTHGQLYVALSRVISKQNLKILLTNNSIIHNESTQSNNVYTKNIVFHEVL